MRSVPPYKRGGQLSVRGAIWAIFIDAFPFWKSPKPGETLAKRELAPLVP